MSLPTVSYHQNDLGTSGPTVVMPKLTEMLLSSGWEISYVNSDAIGTGTVENPAWDKAYASGVTVGTIIFKIPDIVVGWPSTYIRLDANWGTATTRWGFTQVSVGNNLGAGESSDFFLGGAVITSNPSITVNTTSVHTLSVSEHGFYLRLNSATNPVTVFFERLRNSFGEVTDEFLLHVRWGTSSFIKVSPPLGTLQSRCLCLAAVQPTATILTTKTTQSPNYPNATTVVGPYFAGGAPFHPHPRLAVILSDADVTPNSFIPLVVDGGSKQYKVEPNVIGTTTGIFAVATE